MCIRDRISVVLAIAVAAFVFMKGSRPSGPKRSYEPPPPLLEPNQAVGVRIKKTFGSVNLEVNAGVVKPNMVIPANILEYAITDKGYKLKLKNVKIDLREGDKSMELEADLALSNEEFSRMTIKGIHHINQKGFKINPDTRAIKLTIRNDKMHLEKLM